jgi:hypothetical protein
MEEARRLRISAFSVFFSAMRLARTWAYSFWRMCQLGRGRMDGRVNTYGLVLDLLGLAALERDAVALVLQALGSDQALDAGSLGVRLLALTLGLDLAADDVLADLLSQRVWLAVVTWGGLFVVRM